MKKTILILLLTIANANTCKDDMREADRNIEKAMRERFSAISTSYRDLAIKHLIDAKFDCRKEARGDIEKRIKELDEM